MSGQQNETPQQISLADAIAELRAELSRARRAAEGQDIRFSVEEIEVELSLEFGATRSASGGFKVFSFVDLSGKLGASSQAAHKLKLKLTIDPPGQPSPGAIQDDEGPLPVKPTAAGS
jgi:hypothetical protein